MKLKFKIDNASLVVERQFSLRSEPALSYTIQNAEITADLEQLLTGAQDIFKMLNPEIKDELSPVPDPELDPEVALQASDDREAARREFISSLMGIVRSKIAEQQEDCSICDDLGKGLITEEEADRQHKARRGDDVPQ